MSVSRTPRLLTPSAARSQAVGSNSGVSPAGERSASDQHRFRLSQQLVCLGKSKSQFRAMSLGFIHLDHSPARNLSATTAVRFPRLRSSSKKGAALQ